jgi:hypothetical protein
MFLEYLDSVLFSVSLPMYGFSRDLILLGFYVSVENGVEILLKMLLIFRLYGVENSIEMLSKYY